MVGTKTPRTQSTASLSSTGSKGSGADLVFDEYDERPFVKDLLAEKSSNITTVRNAIQTHPLYEPSRYDDIWILRFLLSHKNDTVSASRTAIATMEFRKEYNLNGQDLRGRIKHVNGAPSASPGYGIPYSDKFDVCAEENAIIVALPDKNRGLILYLCLSKIDMNKINETMTQEDIKNATIYQNEAFYQVLDGITRKTGRLTKLTKVIDFDGMALKQMNRVYLSKNAAASKEVDDYWPQLLGGLFTVNAPKWINVLWKFVRPLMPKRVVEKVDFLPSNKKKVPKFLARFVSKENLLERYGGENKEWPPAFVGSHFK